MTEQTETKVQGTFERLSDFMSYTVGTPAAFVLAVLIVVLWAAFGPFADFSNTWQLFINTVTTTVTFVMVFLLGNASNRITRNQAEMLQRILTEEDRVAEDERLIRVLIDRMDTEHIQPILQHLDAQDRQAERIAERTLAALQSPGQSPPASST